MAKLTKAQLALRQHLHANAVLKAATADHIEYIVVADKTSKVLKSGTYIECKRHANLIRAGGGEVTIFRATKG